MANVPNPRTYERDINLRIAAAIAEIVEREEELANSQYVGKTVQFDFRWHTIDPNMTTIKAPITGVRFEEDRDGDFRLMFEVEAVDPRNGQKFTLRRSRNNLEFV